MFGIGSRAHCSDRKPGGVPGNQTKWGSKMGGFVKALPKTVISVAAALIVINFVRPYLPEQVNSLLG